MVHDEQGLPEILAGPDERVVSGVSRAAQFWTWEQVLRPYLEDRWLGITKTLRKDYPASWRVCVSDWERFRAVSK